MFQLVSLLQCSRYAFIFSHMIYSPNKSSSPQSKINQILHLSYFHSVEIFSKISVDLFPSLQSLWPRKIITIPIIKSSEMLHFALDQKSSYYFGRTWLGLGGGQGQREAGGHDHNQRRLPHRELQQLWHQGYHFVW